jgi:hypothetical protein
MKPFSKFEAIRGKPVVTRDGRKVTQIKEFELEGPYKIVAVVEGEKEVATFTDDGKFDQHHSYDSKWDLFMATETHEGWIAFGPEQSHIQLGLVAFTTHAFPSEESAKQSYRNGNHGHEPKGTVRISWEE